MKKVFKRYISNNIIWIIFLVLALYIFVSGLLEALFLKFIFSIREWSPAMSFILSYYAYTVVAVVVLVVVCLIVKKNRFILRSFLPKVCVSASLIKSPFYTKLIKKIKKHLIFRRGGYIIIFG